MLLSVLVNQPDDFLFQVGMNDDLQNSETSKIINITDISSFNSVNEQRDMKRS